MATRMTSFAAILNILPFAIKMEQNQNDNVSNVAMSNTKVIQVHIIKKYCIPCIYIQKFHNRNASNILSS